MGHHHYQQQSYQPAECAASAVSAQCGDGFNRCQYEAYGSPQAAESTLIAVDGQSRSAYDKMIKDNFKYTQDNYEEAYQAAAKEGKPIVAIVGSWEHNNSRQLVQNALPNANQDAIYLYIDPAKPMDKNLAAFAKSQIASGHNSTVTMVFTLEKGADGKPHPEEYSYRWLGAHPSMIRSFREAVQEAQQKMASYPKDEIKEPPPPSVPPVLTDSDHHPTDPKSGPDEAWHPDDDLDFNMPPVKPTDVAPVKPATGDPPPVQAPPNPEDVRKSDLQLRAQAAQTWNDQVKADTEALAGDLQRKADSITHPGVAHFPKGRNSPVTLFPSLGADYDKTLSGYYAQKEMDTQLQSYKNEGPSWDGPADLAKREKDWLDKRHEKFTTLASKAAAKGEGSPEQFEMQRMLYLTTVGDSNGVQDVKYGSDQTHSAGRYQKPQTYQVWSDEKYPQEAAKALVECCEPGVNRDMVRGLLADALTDTTPTWVQSAKGVSENDKIVLLAGLDKLTKGTDESKPGTITQEEQISVLSKALENSDSQPKFQAAVIDKLVQLSVKGENEKIEALALSTKDPTLKSACERALKVLTPSLDEVKTGLQSRLITDTAENRVKNFEEECKKENSREAVLAAFVRNFGNYEVKSDDDPVAKKLRECLDYTKDVEAQREEAVTLQAYKVRHTNDPQQKELAQKELEQKELELKEQKLKDSSMQDPALKLAVVDKLIDSPDTQTRRAGLKYAADLFLAPSDSVDLSASAFKAAAKASLMRAIDKAPDQVLEVKTVYNNKVMKISLTHSKKGDIYIHQELGT